MKLTRDQKIRLKALLSKDAKSLTADETTELNTLTAAAKAANWDAATDPIEDEDEKGLTDDEVKGIVVDALKGIGLDAETVTAIKDGLKASGKSLTAEDVSTAIQKHLGGNAVDQKALTDAVTKAVSAQKGLTEADLTKALENFSKNLKSPSRHEFPVNSGEASFPIESRAGNLTVGQKQLLNICMMHVGESAILSGKSVRPKSENDGITAEQLAQACRNGEFVSKTIRAEMLNGRKAITAGGSGSGAELVNTDLSSDLQTRLYLESAVAAEFVGQEIQMPTNPFQLPMTTTRPFFRIGDETGSVPTASTPATTRPTLTAGKLIGMSEYSYEAEEDAIIAILPMLQEQLGSAAADALEGALINGDTGTHMDGDIEAVSGHSSKLFKGFRSLALDAGGICTVDISAGGISTDNIGSMRKNMGKYGIKPRDLILIAGPKGYNDLVQLAETLTFQNVGTGSLARILTGDAPSLFGMRIITSAQCREDLNAAGVDEVAGVADRGSILIVHKPSFLLGVRRGFTVEVDTDKRTQMNSVIASFRRAFTPKETPSTTEPMVILGFKHVA
jgi:HK97 family phage major capsid protein